MRRVKAGKYFVFTFGSNLDKIWFAKLFPFLRARAVGNCQIDILGLHHIVRLVMAKIMARATHANILHHLNGQRFFIHPDATNTA